jgi:hypothetical protein
MKRCQVGTLPDVPHITKTKSLGNWLLKYIRSVNRIPSQVCDDDFAHVNPYGNLCCIYVFISSDSRIITSLKFRAVLSLGCYIYTLPRSFFNFFSFFSKFRSNLASNVPGTGKMPMFGLEDVVDLEEYLSPPTLS